MIAEKLQRYRLQSGEYGTKNKTKLGKLVCIGAGDAAFGNKLRTHGKVKAVILRPSYALMGYCDCLQADHLGESSEHIFCRLQVKRLCGLHIIS